VELAEDRWAREAAEAKAAAEAAPKTLMEAAVTRTDPPAPLEMAEAEFARVRDYLWRRSINPDDVAGRISLELLESSRRIETLLERLIVAVRHSAGFD
jgi:hypothetical protein